MASVLVDTHALIWHLFEPNQLSAVADNSIQTAITSVGETVWVSAISLVEIAYLIEKRKLPASHWTNIISAITDPATNLKLLNIDIDIGINLHRIPRSLVPDMPDRIIATTGLVYLLPVITCDKQIQSSPISTIW